MFRKLWKTVTWLVFLFWVFGAIYRMLTASAVWWDDLGRV